MRRIRVIFEPVKTPDELAPLRRRYLEQLSEAQAPLLEVMTRDAARYLVRSRGGVCGYVIVCGLDTLVELHVERAHIAYADAIAREAVSQLRLRRALVQQFDALFLCSCIPLQQQVRSLGLISRDCLDAELPALPDLHYTSRAASVQDLAAIERVDQQVFTHRGRLLEVLNAGHVRLFERAGEVIGFGIMRPLVSHPRAVELGIAVDRPFRRRGFAAYLLRGMVDECLAAGLQPVGGCTEDNHSSRHTAERVGLVARYRLLELTFASAVEPSS